MSSRAFLRALALLLAVVGGDVWALEWFYLVPNPAYTRDLAMGGSTIALPGPPQSQSPNPAALDAFARHRRRFATVYFDPGGAWQLSQWIGQGSESVGRDGPATVPARLLINTVAARWKAATLAGIFGQPVMLRGDVRQYDGFERSWGLERHQNSLLLSLDLHRRIAVAGRVDRYYHGAEPQGDGYNYGILLRPRSVTVGLQYQRFPASGTRVWHPLDTRRDETVSAGMAFGEDRWRASVQVMNLTSVGDSIGLEPRIGAEYRPWRHLGVRAGMMAFSGNDRWSWTSGLTLIDANWFRERRERLAVPDDILQAAVAVIYDRRTPVMGIGSLTLSWRL